MTDRNYVADSGAVVVMEAETGRIVAMASQPTYDPSVWVGGISKKQLARLYSEQAGDPLLGRATQGQFAPGLDVEAVHDAVGALNNGFTPDTRLDCSSGAAGRQPVVQELRVGVLRLHRLRQGAPGLLQHVLLPGRPPLLAALRLRRDDVDAKDPLVEEAKTFGFGSETGIDLPGEAAGRIADRHWKLSYWKSMKDYYCEIDAQKPDGQATSCTCSPTSSASRATPTGPATP